MAQASADSVRPSPALGGNQPLDQIAIAPSGDGYLLTTTTVVDRPIDEVFAFFADAGNLEQLTPPTLNFKILTPQPIEMREGALIDYRIRVHGVPIKWKTEITAWEPDKRFIDEQRRGPYLRWIHEHTFEQTQAGVLVADRVDYKPPMRWLSHPLLIKRDLTKIFTFRREALHRRFAVS